MQHISEPFPESSKPRLLLNANHSTGQLIPACRAQILRAKREILRRKINQVADQIFNLKYDTQYETRQLHKLTEKGNQLFTIAQTTLQKVKIDIQESLKPSSVEDLSLKLDLQTVQDKKCQISDRSTQMSALSEPKEILPAEVEINMKDTIAKNKTRRSQTYCFTQSNIKPLNMKKLSISQTLLRSKIVNELNIQKVEEKSMRAGLVRTFPIQGIFIILFGITIIVLLI